MLVPAVGVLVLAVGVLVRSGDWAEVEVKTLVSAPEVDSLVVVVVEPNVSSDGEGS